MTWMENSRPHGMMCVSYDHPSFIAKPIERSKIIFIRSY